MKLILTLCALTVCSAFSLQAQAPGGGKGGQHMSAEDRFKKLDTNADGFLSKDEFMAGPFGQKNPDAAAKKYAEMDKKGDGKVTLDEFKAALPKVAAKKAAALHLQPQPNRLEARISLDDDGGHGVSVVSAINFGGRSHHRSTEAEGFAAP